MLNKVYFIWEDNFLYTIMVFNVWQQLIFSYALGNKPFQLSNSNCRDPIL